MEKTRKTLKNVLLITIDQWRFDFLGANGYSYMHTPVLDALAKNGCLFKNHRSVTAPCGPARNSLLSGRYQHSHRQILNGTPTKLGDTNIALEMRKNGVWPVVLGYTDQAPEYQAIYDKDPAYRHISGLMSGFDQLFALDDNYYLWNSILRQHGYGVQGDELQNFLPCPQSLKKNPQWFYGRHAAQYPKHLSMTAVICQKTAEFLAAHHTKDPFFLHTTILQPHPPYIAPEPYNRIYKAKQMPKAVRRSFQDEYVNDWVREQIIQTPNQWMMQGFQGNIRDMSSHEIQELRAVYAGLVSEVDDNLRHIFDTLKNHHLWDSTLIIITSDHGDMLGDHYLQAKLGYWDQSYHIPLLIFDPTRPETHGKIIDYFTESVDIMPTILDCMGYDIPRQCQGASLLPLMQGKKTEWRTATMMEFYAAHPFKRQVFDAIGQSFENGQMNIIQDSDYKLVHMAFAEPLLFDIKKDRHCYHNLSKKRAFAPILAHYYRLLMTKRNHCEDKQFSHMVGGIKGSLFKADATEIYKTRPV